MQEIYLINKSAATFELEINRRVAASLTLNWIDSSGTKTAAVNNWKQAATTLSAAVTANANQVSLTAVTGLAEDQLLSIWDSYHYETAVIKSVDSVAKTVTLYDRLQHAYASGASAGNTILTVTPIATFSNQERWTLEINDSIDIYALYVCPVFYYYNPPLQPVDLWNDNKQLYNHWAGNVSIRRRIKEAYYNEVIPMFRHFFVRGVPVHPGLFKTITLLILQKNFVQDQMVITGDSKWIDIKNALLAEINKHFEMIEKEILVDEEQDGVQDELENNETLFVSRRYRG